MAKKADCLELLKSYELFSDLTKFQDLLKINK